MATHNLDHQPNELLITEIADLKKQVSEMRTLQLQGSAAINFTRYARLDQSITLSANSGGYLVFQVVNTDGKSLFTMIENSYYQDVEDTDHEIGWVTNDYRDKWDIEIQCVTDESTASDIRYRLYMFNHDTSSHTFYWHSRLRVIVSGATTRAV